MQTIVDQLGGTDEIRGRCGPLMLTGWFATVYEAESAILFLILNKTSYMKGIEMLADKEFTVQ
ncbi:hypothetical protein [Sphingomonas sp.]|uniref:hypothetical protein n=1 Tax=Sphingomonas sp. TaxID=28214 RepID=UPI0037511053